MKRFLIHKNKAQAFKCQLMIEGASGEDAEVRMCLELDGGKNIYFNGSLKGDECTIKIPKLNEFKDQNGKLFVEAIIDSTYFKLYESEFELKNSLAVKMVSESITSADESKPENKIQLKLVTLEEEQQPIAEPVKPVKPVKPASIPNHKLGPDRKKTIQKMLNNSNIADVLKSI